VRDDPDRRAEEVWSRMESAQENVRAAAATLRYRVGVVPDLAGAFQHRLVIGDNWVQLAPTDLSAGGSPRRQILSGPAGVGKTQLAAQLARQLRDAGAVHGVFWITASSRSAIVAGYAAAAAEVKASTGAAADLAATQFRAWLSRTPQRWLVVLDGVLEPADLAELWPPESPTGRTVVTTRRRDAALAGRGTVIPVGPFSAEEALRYLSEKLDHDEHRLVEAAGLVADLGSHPLALSQAVTFILDRDLTCAAYRMMLEQAPDLVAVVPEAGERVDDCPLPAARAVAMSLRAADERGPAGLAALLSELFSLLDPNGIPAATVTTPAVREYLGRASNASVDAGQVRTALANLNRLRLVEIDKKSPGLVRGDAVGERIRISAVVQRVARDLTSREQLTHATRAAADALSSIWPEVERDVELAALLRANVAALRASAVAGGATLYGLGGDLPSAVRVHPVLFRAGRSLGEAGQATAAVAYFTALADLTGTRLGAEHPDTLATRHHLARWRGEAGDPEGAAAAFEALLVDRQRVHGVDHPDVLATRNNLALWRGEAGDHSGALPELELLLADCVRLLGADHRYTLTVRSNLARSQGTLGDHSGAVAAFEALVVDRARVLGPDDPDTLAARSSLATWRRAAGDQAGATSTLERLLADQQRVLGPDHSDTLLTRRKMAGWRGVAGDATGAATELAELLDDQTRVLGPDHPMTKATSDNLVRWREVAEGLKPARTVYLMPDQGAVPPRGNLARWRETIVPDLEPAGEPAFRTDNPEVAGRVNRAHQRGMAGDVAGAVAAFEDLLVECAHVRGPGHPDTLSVRGDLGRWRLAAGDPIGAVAVFAELLADQTRTLGLDHHDTVHTRINLAHSLGASGDPAGASAAFEAVVPDARRILGADHPQTLAARASLAQWRAEAGDLAGAVAVQAALLADCRRLHGREHADTIEARSNLLEWTKRLVEDGSDPAAWPGAHA
jgi:hypothetical protein